MNSLLKSNWVIAVYVFLILHTQIHAQNLPYRYVCLVRTIEYKLSADSVSYNNMLRIFDDDIEARRLCRIDINGLFEPGLEIEIETLKGRELNKNDKKYILPNKGDKLVYEYRSGAIIPCRSADGGNRITPIPGLSILKYNDYYYQPNCAQVYNRPHDYWLVKEPFSNNLPLVPKIDNAHDKDLDMNDESVVPNARSHRYIPFNRKLPPKNKLTYRRMGESLYAGYFDQYGRFLWNSKEDPVPLKQLKNDETMILIGVTKIDEPVYEFRSGSLIKGNINRDYYFIPEIGSTIESFRDYQYGVNPRRIYNLPGHFELKEK